MPSNRSSSRLTPELQAVLTEHSGAGWSRAWSGTDRGEPRPGVHGSGPKPGGNGSEPAGTGKIPVIVTLNAPPGKAVVALSAGPSRLARPLNPKAVWTKALHGFAATLTPEELRALDAHPLVARIEPDRWVFAHSDAAMTWTGVSQARQDFGLSGDLDDTPDIFTTDDIVIAGIDTGIDSGHDDLAGKVVGWYDAITGSEEPYDDHGHGTWTASIAAGAGVATPDYRGAAYGAALVGIKVLDYSGSGTMSQVISGVEWMIGNRETYNIRVGNMSLGSPGPSDGRDALCRAVNSAVSAGIVMCVSAGNGGPGRYTAGSPAAASKPITVGALYDPGDDGWALAQFSSRGPTADGRVKPDICLPGVDIPGAMAGTTDQYVHWSGTSASAPFATGIVALMLSADQSLTPDRIKSILTSRSNVKTFGPTYPNIDFGAGVANGYSAIAQAGAYSTSWSDRLRFIFRSGSLPRTRSSQRWRFSVTDVSKPVGVTLVIPTWTPARDFDIYLYDPSGRQVASSTGVTRQEQILYSPAVKGSYSLLVYSYRGSGSYWFNVSFK